jgi:site-specific DNA-methyltransferase (adenine-specific)
VLTASQPFTSALVMSNIKMFKYCWVWDKGHGANFRSLKYQPLEIHEDVCVFYNTSPTYNPIMEAMSPATLARMGRAKLIPTTSEIYNHVSSQHSAEYQLSTTTYPKSILRFKKEKNNQFKKYIYHPTQKPVALFEYLIRTYTNEGDMVLDNCAGSFTTAIACINTNRNYICIEKDEKYFEIGKNRIENHQPLLQAVNV